MRFEFDKDGKKCSCYMCRYVNKFFGEEPCCNCIDSIVNPERYDVIAPCYEETEMRRKYASYAYDDPRGSKESILARYLFDFDDLRINLDKTEDRIDLAMKNRFGSAENQCVKAARITLDDAISNYVHTIEGIIQG